MKLSATPLFSALVALPIALFGCGDKDDGGAAEADADTDTDTDTDTDSDTDADTDSDTDADADADTVTFALDGDWEDTWLTLSLVGRDGDGILLGDTVSTDPAIDAEMVISLPAIEESDLDVDEESGTGIATYVAALHDDLDGEGLPEPGEAVAAVSEVWLVFVNEPDEGWLDRGYSEGWNAVGAIIGGPEAEEVFYELDAVPLPTNMRPVEEVTLSGTYDADSPDIASLRIALIPQVMAEGQEVEALLLDEELSTPFEIALSGAPPDDHMAESGGPSAALESPLVYDDGDASGSFTDGDGAVFGICSDDRPVLLRYSPEVTEIQVALFTMLSEAGVGWWAGAEDTGAEGGGLVALDDSEMSTLSIDENCDPPGGGGE